MTQGLASLNDVLQRAFNSDPQKLSRLLVATNSSRSTSGAVLHRDSIAAVDKLATPGTLTVTAVTESGSNLANSAMNVAVSAGNRWGQTLVATGSVTPTANQGVRIAFAAVPHAEWYDIFLSTDANPKWVGRITEAQRAAGGIFSAVATLSAGGAVNSIDVGIVGTGLAANVNPFAANNAYTPALVTPFPCAGFSRVHVMTKLSVSDLRSLPTLSIIPFFQNSGSSADWHAFPAQAVTLLTATGDPLCQDFKIDVDGVANLAILVDAISGQGAAASVWLEGA